MYECYRKGEGNFWNRLSKFIYKHMLRTLIQLDIWPKILSKKQLNWLLEISRWQAVLPYCCCTAVNANVIWFFNVNNYAQIHWLNLHNFTQCWNGYFAQTQKIHTSAVFKDKWVGIWYDSYSATASALCQQRVFSYIPINFMWLRSITTIKIYKHCVLVQLQGVYLTTTL